ncbi:hypothetical protein [Motilibacter aurantiacus]|uniref:hypothetical protein n=1 Tax=Motilibacter aurantiacus TaxID=2714955 RepID=UPI00140D5FF0|nr:hypothetical protein [Motilibacter aurantiacus]
MTALAPGPAHARPEHLRAPQPAAPEPPAVDGSPPGGRAWALLAALPVLAVAGAVGAAGLADAPARSAAEGALTASAYAVARGDGLGPGRLDPPLAALQVGGWDALTDALSRWDGALGAGREALLLCHLAAVALTMALARRLGLPRVAAAVAGLVLALSPLAVEEARRVTAPGVATPWLLLALWLAAGRSRARFQLAGSAAALSVAALTAPVTLLALPVVAWLALRSTRGRRSVLAVPVTVLTGVAALYAVLATAASVWPEGTRGWPWPASGAAGSGTGQLWDALRGWADRDPVLAVAAVVAVALATRSRALRPLVALVGLLLLVPFVPGAPPAGQAVPVLPAVAVLVVGAVVSEARRARSARSATGWLPAITVALAACLGVLAAGQAWTATLRGLVDRDADAAYRSAAAWVLSSLPAEARVATDDALLPELVAAGRAPVGYAAVEADGQGADSWRSLDVVVVTPALRAALAELRAAGSTGTVGTAESDVVDEGVAAAVRNSVVLATFGAGEGAIEVRRVEPDGAGAATAAQEADAAARARVGTALAGNARLDLPAPARRQLAAGRVDSRVMVVLALALGEQRLGVAGFPAAPGEAAPTPIRTVTVASADGEPVRDGAPATSRLLEVLRAQPEPYAPQLSLAGGRLTVTFPAPSPLGLLPAPESDDADLSAPPTTSPEDP